MITYNPRYTAYCRAHGKTLEGMQKHDRKIWPGGFMAGYMLWIQEKLQEFKIQSPGSFTCDSLTDHKGFDEFLKQAE
ncbi:MAG: hypothetical protein ACLFPI_07830 [Desulfobacterales bacterium]